MEAGLNDQVLENIYRKEIKPEFYDSIYISESKKCIFLGGQPGCGKSYLGDEVKKGFDNKSAVIIDTDKLRRYHPRKDSFTAANLYTLDKEVFKIGDLLIEDTIKAGKNIIFDGTLGGDVSNTLSLIERLKNEGYKIEVAVLAVNEVASKIGIEWRYAKQISESGVGRGVNREYHDKIYTNIPNNLEKLLATNKVDTLNFYSRNHADREIYLSRTIQENNLSSSHVEEIKEFIKERERAFTNDELVALKNWYKSTVKLVESIKGNVGEFKKHILNHNPNSSPELVKQLDVITAETKQINKVEGVIGCDPIFKTVKVNNVEMKVATFTLAEVQEKKVVQWHNVHISEKNFPKNISDIKKGGLLKVEGDLKSFKTPSGEAKEFVISNVIEHKLSQQIDIKVSTHNKSRAF